MAELVNNRWRGRWHCGIFLFACACLASAQDNLPDPTRPPATMNAQAAGLTTSSGPVLQSVLIAPGRRVAVISGQTVQVGDRLGDARVAKITEGQVELVRDGQAQILKLFPGIEKRQAKNTASVRDSGRRQ